jgi:4-hydroxybenzoate polyprenyltransferase
MSGGGRAMWRTLVEQLRIRQWTKNLFVFAPVVFAKQVGDVGASAFSVAAFLCMCLASSATYTVNDLLDADADRSHPAKRRRPIPSGRLSTQSATALAAGLLALAAIGASCLGLTTLMMVLLYTTITLAYSFGLKHVPLLELFLVASGFVIRVLVGSMATGIPASPWVLLTMLFLALLLAFGKRRGEIGRLGDEAPDRRKVLEFYGIPFLDRCITLLAGAALLCYALYCTSEQTVRKMHTEWLIATTPFVAYGILRYLYIVEHGDHAADSPSEILLADRSLQVTIVLWLATAAALIYTH